MLPRVKQRGWNMVAFRKSEDERPIKIQIWKAIRKIIDDKGYGIADLASQMSIGRSSLNRIYSGDLDCSIGMLVRILEFLGYAVMVDIVKKGNM